MKKYGVIMAGGGGTRFWPLSRQNRPKQLLNLSGSELMVNEAIDRLSYTVDKEDIFIVTAASQWESMVEATAGRIAADHILAEPAPRNTAACVGYAAMEILKKYGDGTMVVTPSDAYIRDTAAFTRTLGEAVESAQGGKLVTIGITPTFPATGYGYIRCDGTGIVRTVQEFREKPDPDTAQSYLQSGKYLWNSGMFIWTAAAILEKLALYVPEIYKDLQTIGWAMQTPQEQAVIERIYPEIRKISIDYAVMEPAAAAGAVLVVPGDFGWNDVGSWDMLSVFHCPDEQGNILLGDALAIDSRNTTVYAQQRQVTVIGAEDLVVVETPDAVLVCPRERAQDVKLAVEALQKAGRTTLL